MGVAVTALSIAGLGSTLARAQTVDTRLGPMQLENGYPSREAVEKL